MSTPTTRDRALAIAAGAVFTAGTCAILFEDVLLHSAALTLKHYLTLAVLAGTILAGHLANDARRGGHWLATVGFSAVFLFGTMLVVYSSVGRQAAETIQTTAQIEADAQRRIEIGRARAKSQAMLETAQAELNRQCVIGKASRAACDGIRATIDVYTAAVAGHDAALAKLGAPRIASAEAEQFAEVVHVVMGADKAKVKAGAVLLVPFMVAVFLEFGVIVSLGFAFRHGAPSALIAGGPARLLVGNLSANEKDTAQTSFYGDAPLVYFTGEQPDNGSGGPSGRSSGPDKPHRPAPKTPPSAPDGRKDEVLAALLTDLALGRTFGTQGELCGRFQAPRSTMSDWLREWEGAGLIPARRVEGRRKALAGS